MTVAENISVGLRLAGAAKAEVDAQVRKVSDTLQLTPLLERRPKQLGGGSASGLPLVVSSSETQRCSCSTSRSQT